MKATLLITIITLFTLVSCNPDDIDDISGDGSLADQIEGTFVGMFQNSSNAIPDFSITVTKISDTEVQFAPTNGTLSSTFTATLSEETIGNVTSIKIFTSDDILENNGTFVEATGRLSYSFHLGSDDDYNIEVFTGDKQ
jgi:hypothetical protein